MTVTVATLQAKLTADTSDLESGLSTAQSSLAATATKIAGLGAIAGGAAIAGITALGAAGVAAWSDMDAAADTLMQSTGATGAALDAMTTSVTNLKTGSAGVGVSMADIGTAMGDIAARTGATGPALETLTGTLLQLQAVQGEGAVSATDFGRAMNSWGVSAEQGSSLLDQLFAASQRTGISTAQLSNTLQVSGGALREMGFSIGQSISMLSQLDAAGIESTTAMTGLRTATAKIAEAGGDIQSGLAQAVSAIKNAENSTAGLGIAIDTFGARAGPALADAIRQGTFSLEAFSAGMGETEGAIQSAAEGAMDFPDRMEMAMSRVTVALVPVGQAVMDLADAAMPALVAGAEIAAQGITMFAGFLTSTVIPALTVLSGWLQDNLPGALQTLSDFWVSVLQPAIASVASWVMGTLVPVLGQLLGWLADNLPPALSALASFWVGTLWPAIQAVAGWVSSTLFPLFAQLAVWLGTTLGQALAQLSAFWQQHGDTILSIAQTTWNTIQSVIDSVLGTISGLMDAFQSAREGDWRAFGEKLRELWDAAWQALVNIVSTVGPLIVSAISTLLSNARAEFMAIDWPQLGRDMMQGVANGITAGASFIADAARNAAQNALDAAKGFLGISSPSRVMADEVGLPMAQGIAAGIQQGAPSVTSALSGILSILPQVASAMRGFSESLRGVNMERASQGIASFALTLGGLVDVLEQFDKLKGANLSSGTKNGIANLMIFVHDVIMAAGPARGDIGTDIPGPFKRLAESIGSLLEALTSLSGLLKLTDDVAKTLKASSLTGLREFLVWFTGIAATLVGDAARATVGVEKLNTAGLKPLNDALGPVAGIVSQTGTLVKGLVDAMAFDWGGFSFSGARAALIGLIQGSLYLVQDLGRFNAQIAALKVELGPLGAVVQDASSLATGAFGLIKTLVDAFAFEWASVNFGALRAILAGLVAGALYLVSDLERFTAQIVALRVTLAPLGAVVSEAASLASEVMALLKTLLDALTVNWGAIDFGDVRDILNGLTQIGIFLADGFTSIANTYTGSVTPAAQNLIAVLDLMGGIVGSVMDALEGLWDGLAAVTSINMTPEQVSTTISLIVLTGMDMAAGFLLVANTFMGSVAPNAERAVTAIELAVSPIDKIVKAVGLLWTGLAAVTSMNMTPEQVSATFSLIALTGMDIARGFLLVANTFTGSVTPNAERMVDAMSLVLGAIDKAIDLIKLVAKPPAIPELGSGAGSLRDWLNRLAIWAGEVTIAVGASLTAFGVTYPLLERLGTEADRALGVISTGVDMVEQLTKPPRLPDLNQGGLRAWLQSLARWVGEVTIAVGASLTAFNITFPALERLGTEADRASGVIGTALDLAEKLVKPPALPDLGFGAGSIRAWLNRLPIWLGEVAIAVGASLTAFGVSYPLLDRLGTEADRASGVVGAALDLIEKLSKPPAFPDLNAGGLRQWLNRLPIWLGEVTIAVGATLTTFGVTYPLLDRLKTEADRAVGLIGVGLEAVEKLTNPPDLPPLGSGAGSLRQYLIDLTQWMIGVATEVGRQAASSGITAAWEQAAATLSNTFGSAADAVMKYIDLVQSLGEKLPLTVAGGPNPFGSWWGGTSPNPMLDPAHVAERVKPLIEGIKAIARAMAQAAADLATEGVNVGAGNQLGQNLSGMVDGVLSMVDALDKLSGIRVGGQGLQNLRDLMFQVFGIIAGQAGQAAQVQAVVNAIDAALGGLAQLAGAQGYTAGTNWVDGFVNAVNAGMGRLGGAIPATAPGGGGGVAATTITNNYVTNKSVNINVVNTNADASNVSNAGIVNAVLYA
jgi:phage-related minor tail protein